MIDVSALKSSQSSSASDFDFLVGKWRVRNRKLKTRLANCAQWDEFDSELHMVKALNGLGNIENYYATFDNAPFEGLAIRLFDPGTRLWTIYWIDNLGMRMDTHPVSGSFEKGLGKFYALDVFAGKPITVIYQWDARDPAQPIWTQAFSLDAGENWEWNWQMMLTKID
jgi:hypothetical protein